MESAVDFDIPSYLHEEQAAFFAYV